MLKYLLVGVGGCLGSIARFWVGGYIASRTGLRFPYGTFVVNVSGCFALGFIITLLAVRTHWNANWTYLVPIGFIGAYTTFSTFELETLRAAQDGQALTAVLYVTLSVALGFIALWLGVVAGKSLSPVPSVEVIKNIHEHVLR